MYVVTIVRENVPQSLASRDPFKHKQNIIKNDRPRQLVTPAPGRPRASRYYSSLPSRNWV